MPDNTTFHSIPDGTSFKIVGYNNTVSNGAVYVKMPKTKNGHNVWYEYQGNYDYPSGHGPLFGIFADNQAIAVCDMHIK